MFLGLVVGTVVSTKKNDGIRGTTYLLVAQCSTRGKTKPNPLVALDVVGAGTGELVIVAQGSSARQTDMTKEKPIDAVIVGIVDLIEEEGAVVFRKEAPLR
jgi:microcompartment protein CcmK/EutM